MYNWLSWKIKTEDKLLVSIGFIKPKGVSMAIKIQHKIYIEDAEISTTVMCWGNQFSLFEY